MTDNPLNVYDLRLFKIINDHHLLCNLLTSILNLFFIYLIKKREYVKNIEVCYLIKKNFLLKIYLLSYC